MGVRGQMQSPKMYVVGQFRVSKIMISQHANDEHFSIWFHWGKENAVKLALRSMFPLAK